MPAKLIVLYPPPLDPAAFEAAYHGQHMPLMRRLVGAEALLPTYRVVGQAGAPTIYRVAEIHYPDLAALQAFTRSEAAREGSRSSHATSSGGAPLRLLCAQD